MPSYPGALDTLVNPAGNDPLDNPDHATQHVNLNDIVEALEVKLGTGSSTAAEGTMLVGLGGGASSWEATARLAGFHVPFGTLGWPADDTAVIQAALTATSLAGGGTIVLTFIHGISECVLIPSHCVVMGLGPGTGLRAIAATWSGPGYLLANEHYTDLPDGDPPDADYSDENIFVLNLSLDFDDLADDIFSGNFHALELRNARKIRVDNVLFECRGAGDGLASRHCVDVVVTGCTVFEYTNCGIDFWADPAHVVISNNYLESAVCANQHINFNANEGTTSDGVTVIGNTIVDTSGTAHSIQLEPLGLGMATTNVIFTGNRLYNVSLFLRGNVTQVVVSGNVWYTIDNLPAILCVALGADVPDAVTVTGNVVCAPSVSAVAFDGVFQIEVDNAVIANNVCEGGNSAVPFIWTAAHVPTMFANSSDTDTTIFNRILGPLRVSGAIFPPIEGGGYNDLVGIITSTGVPDNANGENGWYCFSLNGIIYRKWADVWGPHA
jgi:hypothetical protein